MDTPLSLELLAWCWEVAKEVLKAWVADWVLCCLSLGDSPSDHVNSGDRAPLVPASDPALTAEALLNYLHTTVSRYRTGVPR